MTTHDDLLRQIARLEATIYGLSGALGRVSVRANHYEGALRDIRDLQSTIKSKSKQAQQAHDLATEALENTP